MQALSREFYEPSAEVVASALLGHFLLRSTPDGLCGGVIVETEANRAVLRPHDLTNGPAKLCAAPQVDRELDGVDICDSNSPLFIAQNPDRSTLLQQRAPLVKTTRIGLTKVADWPLRWYLGGSEFISKR